VRVVATPWTGIVSNPALVSQINVGLLALMAGAGMLPKPTIPCVVAGVLAVRVVGELTGQDALLFYGAAFAAQLSQGVAHKVSRQPATLLQHEDAASELPRRARLGHEFSHVIFFPNLLLHSCYQSIAGEKVA